MSSEYSLRALRVAMKKTLRKDLTLSITFDIIATEMIEKQPMMCL